MWVVDRNLGRRSLGIHHELGRTHQQFRIGFDLDGNDQKLGPNVDRLLILGLVTSPTFCLRKVVLATVSDSGPNFVSGPCSKFPLAEEKNACS